MVEWDATEVSSGDDWGSALALGLDRPKTFAENSAQVVVPARALI